MTGPGGFEVDLSACPSAWDPYQGLENGVIRLGQTLAQSGTLADYGNVGIAQTIYYDHVNAEGGITDSTGKTYQIKTDIRDDGYDPAKTAPLVDELLDSKGVFALETLGSPKTKSFVGAEAVGGDGAASDGWWIVGPKSATLASGFGFAWAIEQSLRLAAELPGGVSRPNFMLAARVLDMTNPTALDGVTFNMRGSDDAYPVEGSEFGVYDAEKQGWNMQTDLGIIELSGQSKPCAWDQAVSSCK